MLSRHKSQMHIINAIVVSQYFVMIANESFFIQQNSVLFKFAGNFLSYTLNIQRITTDKFFALIYFLILLLFIIINIVSLTFYLIKINHLMKILIKLI